MNPDVTLKVRQREAYAEVLFENHCTGETWGLFVDPEHKGATSYGRSLAVFLDMPIHEENQDESRDATEYAN